MTLQDNENNKTTILYVDHRQPEREKEITALKNEGYIVEDCRDYSTGMIQAMQATTDAIILHTHIQDISPFTFNGMDFLRRVRERVHTPIIILTDQEHHSDELRLEAYKKGADDYLIRPFCEEELVVRLQSLLRRSGYSKSAPEIGFGIDNLFIDSDSKQVKVEDRIAMLTNTEIDLLKVLLKFRGEVLSKPYLQLLLLKRPYTRHDRSMDVHVSNLRKKLASIGHSKDKIRSVRGYGYVYQ